MQTRTLAADAALPAPSEGAFAIIEGAGVIEVLLGIARLNAAELRSLAASLEGAAESQAPGSDQDAFIGMAKIVRRMSDTLAETENCHG